MHSQKLTPRFRSKCCVHRYFGDNPCEHKAYNHVLVETHPFAKDGNRILEVTHACTKAGNQVSEGTNTYTKTGNQASEAANIYTKAASFLQFKMLSLSLLFSIYKISLIQKTK